ncbi:MAG: cobyric acid synthase, partial [Parabacteroides sp.]|nr:cobyric acid synthase [Parabacteroides sp.]
SEINLRDRDITNMRIAMAVGADTYLVADIDRGGVFGSVYGTIMLLRPEEKTRIKGIIINKFRGDIRLFEEGKHMLEELTGIPVVGIIPYYTEIKIEEEDSVALDSKNQQATAGRINVAIVHLKRLSNFTDFNVLEMDKRFHTYYTDNVEEIEKADIIILPGTKNTLGDLQIIRANGISEAIVRSYKAGKKVIGICGGYQMMGMRIEDPNGMEGEIPMLPGLGLLPMCTVIESEKVTQQTSFTFLDKKDTCSGYEIHMGKTSLLPNVADSPLLQTEDGRTDGYLQDNHCWGTYMHGIMDNPVVLDFLAEGLSKSGDTSFDYASFKEAQYDKLAAHIRAHVDLESIYRSLEGNN